MKKLIFLAALLLSCGQAMALNPQDASVRDETALRMAEVVVGSQTKIINIEYVGSSSEAFVSIDGTNVDFFAPFNVLDTDGVRGNGNGRYDLSLSTVDTLGEFCDQVDLLADWKCKLLAGKRDDFANLMRNQDGNNVNVSSENLKGGGGYDISMGTRTQINTLGTVGVIASVWFQGIGITPQPGRYVRLKSCSWNVNATDPANPFSGLHVYGKLKKHEGKSDGRVRDDSTLVWKKTSVDDTTAIEYFDGLPRSFASLVYNNGRIPSPQSDGGLDFAKDAHVVVRNSTGAVIQSGSETIVDTNTLTGVNFVSCVWEERE